MTSLNLSPSVLTILDEYPDLFGSPPFDMRKSLMGFGFSCGPGWLPLIRGSLANLRLIAEEDGLRIRVIQVKEKWDQLRVTTDQGNDRVWALLLCAEATSGQICESCGGPSEVRSRGGWLTTLCEVGLRAPDVPEHWCEAEVEADEEEGTFPVRPLVTPLTATALAQALGQLPPEMPVAIEGSWINDHRPAGGVEVIRVAAEPRRFRQVAHPHAGPGWDSRAVALIRPASQNDTGETL